MGFNCKKENFDTYNMIITNFKTRYNQKNEVLDSQNIIHITPCYSLSLYNDDGSIAESIELKVTSAINLQVVGARRCTNLMNNKLCLKPMTSKTMCSDCDRNSSKHYLPLSNLTYSQVESIKKEENFNYLTIFGNENVKTGVSRVSRNYDRLVEQGSIFAIILGHNDGFTARRLEDQISKNVSITQAVRSETKLKSFLQITNINQSNLLTKLISSFESFKNSLNITSFINLLFIQYPISQEYFNINSIQNLVYILHKNLQPGFVINGKIIAIYATYIVYVSDNDKNTINIIDTLSIIGFEAIKVDIPVISQPNLSEKKVLLETVIYSDKSNDNNDNSLF